MGVFVDRWPRRALLVVANLGRAVMLITFPLWDEVLPGDAELYAALLILLGIGRLWLTTKGAVLPVLVADTGLLRANALSGGGGMIAALGGGIAGVASAGLIGAATTFQIGGIIYAISSFVAGRISTSLAHTVAQLGRLGAAVRRVAADLTEGARAILRRPQASLPLLAIFLLRSAVMIVAIAAILVIKDEYPAAADRFGRNASSALALGAAGAGALVGAVAAPIMGRRLSRSQLILSGFVLTGAAISALGGVFDLRAVLGLTFVGGCGGFLTKVAVDAQVQHALPDDLRGRAFSYYDILYNLASVVAAAVVLTTTRAPLRPVLVATGVVTLAATVALSAAMRRAGLLQKQPG
jgi:hypothetical protein